MNTSMWRSKFEVSSLFDFQTHVLAFKFNIECVDLRWQERRCSRWCEYSVPKFCHLLAALHCTVLQVCAMHIVALWLCPKSPLKRATNVAHSGPDPSMSRKRHLSSCSKSPKKRPALGWLGVSTKCRRLHSWWVFRMMQPIQPRKLLIPIIHR